MEFLEKGREKNTSPNLLNFFPTRLSPLGSDADKRYAKVNDQIIKMKYSNIRNSIPNYRINKKNTLYDDIKQRIGLSNNTISNKDEKNGNNTVKNESKSKNSKKIQLPKMTTKEFKSKVFINGTTECYEFSIDINESDKIDPINFTQNCFDKFLLLNKNKNKNYDNFKQFNLYLMNSKNIVINSVNNDSKITELVTQHIQSKLFLCFYYFKDLLLDEASEEKCLVLHLKLHNVENKEEKVFMSTLNDPRRGFYFPYIISVPKSVSNTKILFELFNKELGNLNNIKLNKEGMIFS